MQRVILEPVFVLHTRPYSNTSLILELLSEQHGRVVALARSARGLQSRYRGELQLFTPLLVSWSGRGEMKTLSHAERRGNSYALQGKALFCAFYVNELLQRLLQREDPHRELFFAYADTLEQLLHSEIKVEPTLRLFEKRLLEHLGYGLPLQRDSVGNPFAPEDYYQYVPEYGFVSAPASLANAFKGSDLVALQQEKLEDERVLQQIKHLMRLALARLLGNKPLKSRELMY